MNPISVARDFSRLSQSGDTLRMTPLFKICQPTAK